MAGKQRYVVLLLHLCWIVHGSWAQHSAYSLQAAVDELHRREAAKYPLNAPPSQQHYFSGILGTAPDQDYWDEETGPPSIFRERESQVVNGPDNAELTEQFLREIEETQAQERQEALRHLWEKYQQQENQIEGDLFEEKKRMRTPYYMLMQKKRSYPVLPWLPYSERKKRFPVSKRSTKRSANESPILGKTNEKVAKELSELFGTSDDDKQKRSIDVQSKISTTSVPDINQKPLADMRIEMPAKKSNSTEVTNNNLPSMDDTTHHNHDNSPRHHEHLLSNKHKHRKRSDHPIHESHEEEEESEEHDEHDDEEEDDDDHEEFEEEEEEERKKKRDLATFHGELLKSNSFPSRDLVNYRKKKSIEWSKYFGIDRKKKSLSNENFNVDVKKRSTTEEDSLREGKEKKRRELDPEKIDSMDKKLQSIEDFIVDETIKYTGAHEGVTNSEGIRLIKDHILSRLATAYSIEKLRRALEKFRQNYDNENHFLRNVIQTDPYSDDNDILEYQKRLSVKKEKALDHDTLHAAPKNEKSKEINSNSMMSSVAQNQNEPNDENYEDVKRKKKRNGYLRFPEQPNEFSDFEEELGAGHYETLNDAYLGNKNYIIGSNQCPLIESMAQRCRGVDLLSGDINQELLPICGVHQICYLCGTSQVACDYQYLAEADSICGNNNECQAAARSVLMILRGTPGPQLGPRECLKNPCLYSAMREIGL